jgi:hypothetical protein
MVEDFFLFPNFGKNVQIKVSIFTPTGRYIMEEFKSTEEPIYFSAPVFKFSKGEYLDGNLPIEGFAVHTGKFKKVVEIPDTELDNISKTLANAQLRIDHSQSVRDIVGLLDEAQVAFNDAAQKPGVRYRAHIDDSEIADGVNKNKIRDVSIGFNADPECSKCGKNFRTCKHWFDEAHVIARNIKTKELSLVTEGADPDAHASAIGFAAQFNNKFDKNGDFDLESLDKNGGSFMEDDKTVDVAALAAQITEAQQEAFKAEEARKALEAKFKAAEAERVKLEAEKKTLADEKTQLETDKADLETKFNDADSKLTGQELAAKKEEATKVAELKVEKGLLKKEEFDADVEKLMKLDSLDAIKDLVSKFKVEEEGGAEVPIIAGFEKFMNKGVIDYDNPELEQMMIHEIFAYDRVFQGNPGDEVRAGQSYMGFSLHK